MTEVFGAAASGAGLVSLAVQLAESAMKLKRLCDQAEKVPDDLRTLEIEIKLFSLVLQDIETSRIQRGVTTTSVLTQCIYYCQIVTGKIVAYVREIEVIAADYKLPGRIYAALRMSGIPGLCNEMERAKSNLMLASLSFQAALQGSLLTSNLAISGQLATLSEAKQPPAYQVYDPHQTADGPTGESETTLVTRKTPSEKYQNKKNRAVKRLFSLRVSWFNQAVWDFSLRRSQGNWGFDFRCGSLVPEDALIFWHAERGDVPAVRKMFSEGKASPYDTRVDDWGAFKPLYTVLHEASSVDMYAAILDGMRDEDRIAACENIIARQGSSFSYHSNASMASFSYLAESQPVDLIEVLPSGEDWHGQNQLATLPVLQRNLLDFNHQWSFEDWFRFLTENVYWRNATHDRLLSYFSSSDDFEGLLRLKNKAGETFLHFIARHIGSHAGEGEDWQKVGGWTDRFASLLRAAREPLLLLKSTDIHGQTMFMAFARGFSTPFCELVVHKKLLPTWIQLLGAAGIDLDRHFREEMIVWKQKHHTVRLVPADGDLWCRFKGVHQDPTTGTWRDDAENLVCLGLWQLHVPIGAWPQSPYVPQTICWAPGQNRPGSDGGRWDYLQDYEIPATDLYVKRALENERERKPWYWWPKRARQRGRWIEFIHDDNEIDWSSRIRKTSHRRSHSEPPILIQAYNARQDIGSGRLVYCNVHTRWNLKTGIGPVNEGSKGCMDERCCNTFLALDFSGPDDFWDFLKISEMWQKFVHSHKVNPTFCRSRYEYRGRGEYPGFFTFDEEALFRVAVGEEPWNHLACDQFPDCEHQAYYLETLKERGEI